MNLLSKDAKLFRKYFKEMARLRGVRGCQYQYITDKYVADDNGTYVMVDGRYVRCTQSDYPNLQHYRKESSKNFSIHGELKAMYSDPEPIDLIFQESPSMKTLRAIGWNSEDNSDGDKPYVIQIPLDTKKVQAGCRVLIPFGLDEEELQRKVFRITKISVIAMFPDCYTCTIVPEFETMIGKSDKDYTDTNSNFLRDFK